jgi:hypothetical protein
MFMVLMRYSVIFCGLAIFVNMYLKAMAFERDFMPTDPEEDNFNLTVEEMAGQVSEIFKTIKNQNNVDGMTFSNQKIVAWLLNRNKEAMSKERSEFFTLINQELKDEAYGAATNAPTAVEYQQDGVLDPESIRLEDNTTYHAANQAKSPHSNLLTAQTHATQEKQLPASQIPVVHPIEFETPYWLIHFLGSLFDLKPTLITNESYQKFRIVIELYTGGNDSRFDLSVVEEVIENLKEYACKVPVLVFSDHHLNKKLYQTVMQLKKNYLMLFFTNDIMEVKKFCKMEHVRD